jgi:hypothetical protein
MTIGMFVSSIVTFLLVIANPKTVEPRDVRLPE